MPRKAGGIGERRENVANLACTALPSGQRSYLAVCHDPTFRNPPNEPTDKIRKGVQVAITRLQGCSSLPFSPAFVARGRKWLKMQGLRPRPTQTYSKYVEEGDGSETQRIRPFPASQ